MATHGQQSQFDGESLDLRHMPSLFEHAPVAIWEEDWSGAKPLIEQLRKADHADVEAYLLANPTLTRQIAAAAKILDFNQAAVDMYGAPTRADFIAFVGQHLYTTGEYGAFCKTVAELCRGEVSFTVYAWEVTCDQRDIYISDTVYLPDAYQDGWQRVIHVTEDITAARQAENALRASEEKYRSLFDLAPISIWEEDWSQCKPDIDALATSYPDEVERYLVEHPELVHKLERQIRIIDFNQSTLNMYRANSRDELWNATRADFSAEDRFARNCHRFAALVRGENRVVTQGWEFDLQGNSLYVRDTVIIPPDNSGDWSRVVRTQEDITENQRLAERIAYQVSHDALTGLVNRLEFEQRLKRLLDSAQRKLATHAFCYIDLDEFKLVNDSGGHMAGDELLRVLSQYLSERVRKRDTLARLGGDEFGLLMENCSLDHAQRIADNLRQAIVDFQFAWKKVRFNISASIGLVEIHADSIDTTSVMSAADAACYAAKYQGRNRVYVYHIDDTEVARHRGEMRWANLIEKAILEQRFELVRQPIVSLKNDDLGNFYELLLRMRDDDGSLIPTGIFLPAAERFNLATKLDQWVLQRALEWLADQPNQCAELFACSINLSGQSLTNDDLLPSLKERLLKTGVAPEKLCFEVTETAAISNIVKAAKVISGLRSLGCLIALDDFGTGLSSFSYLKNLDVDFLKIDGSFVRNLVRDPIDLAMVKSINDIGHVMGKATVAEYVEDELTLQRLKSIGIDYAQGSFFGEPELI